MEMLLEKIRGTVNLKTDMAKRCLKHGTVVYCIETRCSVEKARQLFMDYLTPIHEKLKENKDYIGGNIVIFIEPFLEKGEIPRQIGIMFNRCAWDELPDDLEFKHGHYYLCVNNVTKRNRK